MGDGRGDAKLDSFFPVAALLLKTFLLIEMRGSAFIVLGFSGRRKIVISY